MGTQKVLTISQGLGRVVLRYRWGMTGSLYLDTPRNCQLGLM
jgi:hypothetical protein